VSHPPIFLVGVVTRHGAEGPYVYASRPPYHPPFPPGWAGAWPVRSASHGAGRAPVRSGNRPSCRGGLDRRQIGSRSGQPTRPRLPEHHRSDLCRADQSRFMVLRPIWSSISRALSSKI